MSGGLGSSMALLGSCVCKSAGCSKRFFLIKSPIPSPIFTIVERAFALVAFFGTGSKTSWKAGVLAFGKTNSLLAVSSVSNVVGAWTSDNFGGCGGGFCCGFGGCFKIGSGCLAGNVITWFTSPSPPK